MLYYQCQCIVTFIFFIILLYFSVVLFCSYPSNYSTVVTQSGRCRRRPVVGMKTLCSAASYAAGMWQPWACLASWTAWTADGETSLGSASRLTVWAWACRCRCSQLIGPAVSLYGYGNQERSRMCSWGSQAAFTNRSSIYVRHLNIYFIDVRELYVVILSFTQGWCTYLMDCLLIRLHFQIKYCIQWDTRRRNHVFGPIKGIYTFKPSEKDQ